MSSLLSEMIKGTYCRGSVHDRVLTHESSLGVIEDDKLDWLVDPSVAETELDTTVGLSDRTMPQTTRELDDVRRFLSVKADDERRGVNGIDDASVVGVGTEVLIVLKKINLAKRT
jgi:hypothetical protein